MLNNFKIITLVLFCAFLFCDKNFGNEIEYLIVGHNVNLRDNPSVRATSIRQLPIGIYVRVIKKMPKTVKIGRLKGKWVYIDTSLKDKKGSFIKGWIFDYYLKNTSYFNSKKSLEKITNIKKYKIDVCYGSSPYTTRYEISINGKIKSSLIDYPSPLIKFGQLYRYRNLIILFKNDNKYPADMLYLNKKNQLCLTQENCLGEKTCHDPLEAIY